MSMRIGIQSAGHQGWQTLWQGVLVTQPSLKGEPVIEPVGEPSLEVDEVRQMLEAERAARLAALMQEAA